MSTIVSGKTSSSSSKSGSGYNSKGYYTIVEFAKFLRDNGDKLFEKDAKLCLKTDQIFILQEYLQQIVSYNSTSSSSSLTVGGSETTSSSGGDKNSKKKNNSQIGGGGGQNSKEFLLLYKSNQLHLIQDFLFKITNLKIVSEVQFNTIKDYVKLSIYGSLTYLEIKNCPIQNVLDLQHLRNQLECLICVKSLTKLQDLLQLCGADQSSSPLNWPKLHTLNLSHNDLTTLDSSFRLTTSIEILDLSHNSLRDCGTFLHSLTKLKRLNLSFNKLKSFPDLAATTTSQLEYLDLSFNSIEKIQIENVSKLTQLKHINLGHNLLSDLVEINHLRLLASVNHINVDANPVKLDVKCDQIVKEIVDVIAVKNRMKKKTNQTGAGSGNGGSSWNSSNIYIRQTSISSNNRASAPRITINKRGGDGNLLTTTSVPLLQQQKPLSMPNSSLFLGNRRQNSFATTTTNRKLRAHNVLIEQDNDGDDTDDYYIVNPSNTDGRVDSSTTANNDMTKFLSTSIGDYDSSKLQSELENLKKMRQNYGTEWLISTPSFVEITKLVPAATLKKNTPQSSEPQMVGNDEKQNDNEESKQKEEKVMEEAVVESFAVYKSIVSDTSLAVNFELDLGPEDEESNNNSGTIMCFLTITERQLVEKDETNTELISANELADLESIDIVSATTNSMKVKFKSRREKEIVYQFENSQEINTFIDSLGRVLVNEVNFDSCSIYYCVFCSEFGTKSMLKMPGDDDEDDDKKTKSNNISRNLTCTKCNRYLIKNNIVQTKQAFKGGNYTLKEALNSMKPVIEEDTSTTTEATSVVEETTSTSELDTTAAALLSQSTLSSEQMINELDERLKSLMNTTQISKVKLDEINSEARRVNNNLKLYLIINYFNHQHHQESNDEESLICIYKLRKIIFSSSQSSSSSSSLESDCLCVLTNKSVMVFKIVNRELYDQQAEFDKSIRIEYSFSVNQIEYIDVALGQHYFQLEVVVDNDQESSSTTKQLFKFITMDVYQTQAYLNTLLKIINESKNFPILKQIRKNSELTSQNLSAMLNKIVDGERIVGRLNSAQVNLFTFIDSFKLNNEEIPQRVFDPETSCLELFVYNNERVLIVEENLCYFQHQQSTAQFNLVESARISDIVHLKLFKENENQLEVSIVDEMRNSKQINWSFNLNKQFLLSQLISILKENWEKIFFVELPINF